jgi:hypothetical protein
MMYRAPTRPVWTQLVEIRDCWTACRIVTRYSQWPQQVPANDHSKLQPMTTAGCSQWPQQVAANDHSRLQPVTTAGYNQWPQQVIASDHSKLQPVTTTGYSQWPQQFTAIDHSRPFSHDSFISIRASYASWRCHPLRPDSLHDLVIIAYHFHGQEDEVATKLRPLQSQE